METIRAEIPDVLVLRPDRFGDGRGFLSETFRRSWFSERGIEFVQENHSLSTTPGTVRGLHFQIPPHAQGKLVRVVHGSVMDVALDLRMGSPTYRAHVSRVLSADNWEQLWVPAGFAHGFCTIEPNTEVVYKLTDYYAPDAERGLRWDDPLLGIEWPEGAGAVVGERDRAWPDAAELPEYFRYPAEENA